MKIKISHAFVTTFTILLTMLLFITLSHADVIRVKPNGNNDNTGANWEDAKQTITAAINAAEEGDEIWVAAGTYQEHIKNKVVNESAVNVALFGGFAGTENSREERSWTANLSILDGTGNGAVVTITHAAGPATRFDGFVIQNGNANPLNPLDPGGGIRMVISAPVIANNTIKLNISQGYGAGIAINGFKVATDEHPVVSQNTIVENFASDFVGDGAGIALIDSSPTISDNIIARNQASQNGGGIACWKHSQPLIANNFIMGNASCLLESVQDGSGSVRPSIGGGGIFASATDLNGTPISDVISAPEIINNIIAANGGYLGAGICAIDSILDAATITNNTIVANNGSGIFWQNTSPRISNNIVAYNTWGLEQIENLFTLPTIAFNCIFGNILKGEPSDVKGLPDPIGINGNISTNPIFANFNIGNFHIQPSSPCVDAGDTDAVGSGWVDIDDENRVSGTGVDMGADESDGLTWDVPTPIIRVKPDGNDGANGTTWTNAKKTVTGGINAALKTGGDVWVAAGTYLETITLPPFVYLYGGFSGSETNRIERNITDNPVILDGGQSERVVTCTTSGYLVSTVDGFTVQNGSSVTFGGGDLGGGFFCRVTGPMIANNTIQNNTVGVLGSGDLAQGGGIACYLSYAVISGNTITNNEVFNTFDGSGGGIYCNRSMPYIVENTLSENLSLRGPAVYCFGSEPRISQNVVFNNEGRVLVPLYWGSTHGAVTLQLCRTFLVEDNLIAKNIASIGAGLRTESCFAGRVQNNLIINNMAWDYSSNTGGLGGGIYCEAQSDIDDDITIVNNTIVGNTATAFLGEQGGGIAVSVPPPLPPINPPPPAKLTIANNIIAFNSSGIYQLLTTPMLTPALISNDVYNTGENYINLSPGATDISDDPLFADPNGPDNDPETTDDNDYRLTADSPCVDSGDDTLPEIPDADFEGDTRPLDGDYDGNPAVDIGADEFDGCAGDMDGDGDVDGADLAVFAAGGTEIDPAAFAAHFGRTDCP